MTEPGPDHRLPVIRGTDDEPHRKAPPEQFIGDARVHSVSELLGTEQTRIRYVVFEPGARTRPHRHSKDQLLCFHGGFSRSPLSEFRIAGLLLGFLSGLTSGGFGGQGSGLAGFVL